MKNLSILENYLLNLSFHVLASVGSNCNVRNLWFRKSKCDGHHDWNFVGFSPWKKSFDNKCGFQSIHCRLHGFIDKRKYCWPVVDWWADRNDSRGKTSLKALQIFFLKIENCFVIIWYQIYWPRIVLKIRRFTDKKTIQKI